MSASFWLKKQNAETFEDVCVPNGTTGKVATCGGSYLFMQYDVFSQNADLFFKEGANHLQGPFCYGATQIVHSMLLEKQNLII